MLAPFIIYCGALPASLAVGWIADRYGVRRLIMRSQIALGLSFVGLGAFTSKSLGMFLFMYFLMGIVAAGTDPIGWQRAIVGWFTKARGMAIGLATSGTGIAGALLPMYLAWFVEHYGWRSAYFALAALPICIGLLVAYFFLKEPPDIHRQPGSRNAGSETSTDGLSLTEALKSRRYWIIACTFTIAFTALVAILVNLVPMLTDRGYSLAQATKMAGVIGVTIVIGRLTAAILLDWVWAPAIGFCVFAAAGIGAFLLADLHSGLWATTGAIALVGFTIGAGAALLPYVVSRYFGRRTFGRAFAVQWILYSTGSGVGPAIYGFMYDKTGSYQSILTTSSVLLLLAAVLLFALGKYPTSETREPRVSAARISKSPE